MKYLVLSFLFLTACGQGYSVENGYANDTICEGTTKQLYKCVNKRPIFFFDRVMKICTDLDECNQYCSELEAKEN